MNYRACRLSYIDTLGVTINGEYDIWRVTEFYPDYMNYSKRMLAKLYLLRDKTSEGLKKKIDLVIDGNAVTFIKE